MKIVLREKFAGLKSGSEHRVIKEGYDYYVIPYRGGTLLVSNPTAS